jgi:sugar phosphate isomerase/epimerase
MHGRLERVVAIVAGCALCLGEQGALCRTPNAGAFRFGSNSSAVAARRTLVRHRRREVRRIPVAIQMFTVQAEVDVDPRKAIEAVAGIGYEGIEGGYDSYGMTPKEYKSFLDSLDLKVTCIFATLEEMERDLRPKIDLALEVGIKRIGIPYVDGPRRQDEAGWLAVAETADKAGRLCSEHGLELVYHNHSFEFALFGGRYGLDIFYGNTDPALVKAQLDTYWLQHGGVTPADCIRKYSDRLALLHVKDMLDDADRSFAEVGEGILDWPAILAAAAESPCEWLIVEQDVCKRPCLESARISCENIKRFQGEPQA